MAKPPDWLGLERKISAGKLLAQAADEMGIELEAAKAYLADRSKDDDGLRLTAAYALSMGIQKLAELAEGKERLSSSAIHGAKSAAWESVDLKAAQSLVKAGLDIKRLLRPREPKGGAGGGEPGQEDLFDKSPWQFKQPDK